MMNSNNIDIDNPLYSLKSAAERRDFTIFKAHFDLLIENKKHQINNSNKDSSRVIFASIMDEIRNTPNITKESQL